MPPSLKDTMQIVDFVVWLLFSREKSTSRPMHLLCDGFKSHVGGGRVDAKSTSIPGLYVAYPNSYVSMLKQSPWPEFLLLLGQSGERIMMDMLVDGAIFCPLQVGLGNLFQMSGESKQSRHGLP